MHPEHEPLDVLRRANPVDTDRLPSASVARLRARVMEETMGTSKTNLRGGDGRRSPWPALAGAAAISLVIAVVVGGGLVGAPGTLQVPSQSPAPTATPAQSGGPVASGGPAPTGGPVGGGGMAMCAFLYDLETLQDRHWAFDGTLTAVVDNQGTFAVNDWFKGGEGEAITVTVDGMTAESGLLGGPGLEVGGRYLVSGDDEFAWSCGFTQYWNADVAADWARVLGG